MTPVESRLTQLLIQHGYPWLYDQFKVSPYGSLGLAVAMRTIRDVRVSGGVDPLETCTYVRRTSAQAAERGEAPFGMRLANEGALQGVFRWDGASWRIAQLTIEE